MMKANEKLKAKALEYQNTSKYSGNRDGKLCFNKSIYPVSICGNAVKTTISKSILETSQQNLEYSFVLQINRENMENEDLPLDVVDLITIKVVNRIIVNKHNHQITGRVI